MRDEPPFRADHVGSLLRPDSIVRARKKHFEEKAITASDLHEVEDAALRGIEMPVVHRRIHVYFAAQLTVALCADRRAPQRFEQGLKGMHRHHDLGMLVQHAGHQICPGTRQTEHEQRRGRHLRSSP